METAGNSDIGLNLLGSFRSFVFGRGTTFAIFQLAGNVLFSMQRLKIYVSGSTIYGRAIFKNSELMVSLPKERLFSILLMDFPTSNTESTGMLQYALSGILSLQCFFSFSETVGEVGTLLLFRTVSAAERKCSLNTSAVIDVDGGVRFL